MRRSRLERLEDRSFMAAGVSSVLSGGVLTITGTNQADRIVVRRSNDVLSVLGTSAAFDARQVRSILIDALGGDDAVLFNGQATPGCQAIVVPTTIRLGDGDDTVIGSEGADTIFGGAGLDQVYSQGGDDFIDAGAGNDIVVAGSGNDQIFGDLGNDILWGEAGNDTIVGGDGDDSLYGGDGADRLDGSRGSDRLDGGRDNDGLYDDAQGNTIDDADGRYAFTQGHFGWLDMNLQDAGLRTLARSRFIDQVLDRNDMIAILRWSDQDSMVTEAEYADLRRLVTPGAAQSLRMPEYVRHLANKVVNGDNANEHYLGASLGFLRPYTWNIVPDLVDKLVNKWFLGLDHPLAKNEANQTFGYQYAQGSLFVDGPSYTDVRQGAVGDCYFLTALGLTAFRTPSVITSMFIDNGDGTFTVRFYKYGEADYRTVDRWLPVDRNGRFAFANSGRLASDPRNELWVALAEKAYVQAAESGWVHPVGNEYRNCAKTISGGYVAEAIRQITNRRTGFCYRPDFNAMVKAFNEGHMISLASKTNIGTDRLASPDIAPRHAHAVVGYDARTQTFLVFNPWGINNGSKPGLLRLSFAQIQANFNFWDRTM
jgi:Ca2+-binding RTX toxin-like protein